MIQNASPPLQSILLVGTNTVLLIASEFMLKFFKVDILHAVAGVTGATIPAKGQPQQSRPPRRQDRSGQCSEAFNAFRANFTNGVLTLFCV